jgi:hypothetical protein
MTSWQHNASKPANCNGTTQNKTKHTTYKKKSSPHTNLAPAHTEKRMDPRVQSTQKCVRSVGQDSPPRCLGPSKKSGPPHNTHPHSPPIFPQTRSQGRTLAKIPNKPPHPPPHPHSPPIFPQTRSQGRTHAKIPNIKPPLPPHRMEIAQDRKDEAPPEYLCVQLLAPNGVTSMETFSQPSAPHRMEIAEDHVPPEFVCLQLLILNRATSMETFFQWVTKNAEKYKGVVHIGVLVLLACQNIDTYTHASHNDMLWIPAARRNGDPDLKEAVSQLLHSHKPYFLAPPTQPTKFHPRKPNSHTLLPT